MITRSVISFQTAVATLLIFALLLIVSKPAWSSTPSSPIGTVKEIRSGTLERQDSNIWKPLTVGMVISANDRVRTGADSTAILTINEIGAILIGPGTEYYLGDPSRGFKSLLKRGYLWISAKLVPGRTMSVATDRAVSGVRGTKFSVIQDAQGMDVCTCKGEVEVSFKDGKTMNITSGMYGEINASGKAGTPEKGKSHLEKIWNEKPERYKPCLNCHRRGQKIGDLN